MYHYFHIDGHPTIPFNPEYQLQQLPNKVYTQPVKCDIMIF